MACPGNRKFSYYRGPLSPRFANYIRWIARKHPVPDRDRGNYRVDAYAWATGRDELGLLEAWKTFGRTILPSHELGRPERY